MLSLALKKFNKKTSLIEAGENWKTLETYIN